MDADMSLKHLKDLGVDCYIMDLDELIEKTSVQDDSQMTPEMLRDRKLLEEYCTKEQSQELRMSVNEELKWNGFDENDRARLIGAMDFAAGGILHGGEKEQDEIFSPIKSLIENLGYNTDVQVNFVRSCLQLRLEGKAHRSEADEYCLQYLKKWNEVSHGKTRIKTMDDLKASINKELIIAGIESREERDLLISMMIDFKGRPSDSTKTTKEMEQSMRLTSKIIKNPNSGLHVRNFLIKLNAENRKDEKTTFIRKFMTCVGYPENIAAVQYLYGKTDHFFPTLNPSVEQKFALARRTVKQNTIEGFRIASQAILECSTNVPFKVKLYPGGVMQVKEKHFERKEAAAEDRCPFEYFLYKSARALIHGDSVCALVGIMKAQKCFEKEERKSATKAFQLLRRVILTYSLCFRPDDALALINESIHDFGDEAETELYYWRSAIKTAQSELVDAAADLEKYFDRASPEHPFYTRALYCFTLITAIPPICPSYHPTEIFRLAQASEKHNGQLMFARDLKDVAELNTSVRGGYDEMKFDCITDTGLLRTGPAIKRAPFCELPPPWLQRLRDFYSLNSQGLSKIEYDENLLGDMMKQYDLAMFPWCDSCGVKSKDLLLCKNCKIAKYCDSKCQKADWKKHKADCKRNTWSGFGKPFKGT